MTFWQDWCPAHPIREEHKLLGLMETRSAIPLCAVPKESKTRARPASPALWHPDALFCVRITPQSIPGSSPGHLPAAGALQKEEAWAASSQKAPHTGRSPGMLCQQISSGAPGGQFSCYSTPCQSQKELTDHHPKLLLHGKLPHCHLTNESIDEH